MRYAILGLRRPVIGSERGVSGGSLYTQVRSVLGKYTATSLESLAFRVRADLDGNAARMSAALVLRRQRELLVKDSLLIRANPWQAIGLCAALAGGCAWLAAPKDSGPNGAATFASCVAKRCSFDLTISMQKSGALLEILRRACHPSRSCPTTISRLTDADRNAHVMQHQESPAASLAPCCRCPGCAEGGAMSFELRGSNGSVHEHA